MAAISNTENEAHTAQQKVKKQHLTLTDVEEVNWIVFLMQYIELHYIYNLTR
jgi:hypothetical protein